MCRGHMPLQVFGDLRACLGEAQQAQSAVARVSLAHPPSLLLQLLHETADAALLQGQRGAQLLLRERRAFRQTVEGVDLGQRERPAWEHLLRPVRAHLAEHVHQELVERRFLHTPPSSHIWGCIAQLYSCIIELLSCAVQLFGSGRRAGDP